MTISGRRMYILETSHTVVNIKLKKEYETDNVRKSLTEKFTNEW